MEYSIQDVVGVAGVTSRTLRHYDAIGLLPPVRIGSNGYRMYDEISLVRLQRILLLRQLGLSLAAIGDVLDAQDSSAGTASAGTQAQVLKDHLAVLHAEQERLARQIASVERTIAALTADNTEGRDLMGSDPFDGFDHTQYRQEVEQRWGADAYRDSDQWWRGLGGEGQAEWKGRAHQLGLDWIAAATSGADPTSADVQDLARRHVEWLRAIPGTPAHSPDGDLAGYLLGLGEMYVADERFAANYGGTAGAAFVRDALRHYVEENLN